MVWNVYFTYFQSQLSYGIILWGGTRESIKALYIQKKVINLITGIKNMNPVDRNLRKI
jgi:hypothetical protein